jgi:hypothetical protein
MSCTRALLAGPARLPAIQTATCTRIPALTQPATSARRPSQPRSPGRQSGGPGYPTEPNGFTARLAGEEGPPPKTITETKSGPSRAPPQGMGPRLPELSQCCSAERNEAMPTTGVWKGLPRRQVHATFFGRYCRRASCLSLGRKAVTITYAEALAKRLTPCKLRTPPPYGALRHSAVNGLVAPWDDRLMRWPSAAMPLPCPIGTAWTPGSTRASGRAFGVALGTNLRIHGGM